MRFIAGFFIGALVFNTPLAIETVAKTAQVAKIVVEKSGEAGEAVWEQLDSELVKREVLPPKEQRPGN